MKLQGIPDSGLRRIAQSAEGDGRDIALPDVEEMAAYFALRWSDVGNLMYDADAFASIMGDLLGMSAEEFRELQYTDEWDLIRPIAMEAWSAVQDERYLPSPLEGTFRFSHSAGMQGGIGLVLMQSILSQGLVSQPEGAGRSSESPTSVFGVGVNHPSSESERHNKHFPWVTVDVPLDGSVPLGGDLHPGGVVFTGFVPPEYIVGVNGVTPEMFEAALSRWGPYEGPR